jgi:outer membrane protein OmpA-like peptidoglycan-associated protein
VRAELLKEYLTVNGVDPKRMEIKAWGGKRPVVDKMHTQAENNVRVEIEILEN